MFEFQSRELRESRRRCNYFAQCNACALTISAGVAGERCGERSRLTEAYLIRHYQTGEVIKVRANGTDYVERFGATYHQVYRADLHVALAAAILRNDPNCVFLDHCFERLTQDSEQIVATFTNGKTLTSDVLIGCDGAASKVRAFVFGDGVVNYTDQVAFRALLPMAKVPASITKMPYAMFVGINRVLLHYPLRHRTIMNVISIVREPSWQEEGWTIPATIKELARLHSDFHPDALDLMHAISPRTLFKWGLRDREPLQQYSRGLELQCWAMPPHPMTPFLGQGACVAIEDAMVLGRAFRSREHF